MTELAAALQRPFSAQQMQLPCLSVKEPPPTRLREKENVRSFVSVTNESLALSLATHLFSPVTKASDNEDYYRLQRRKRQRAEGGEGAQ